MTLVDNTWNISTWNSFIRRKFVAVRYIPAGIHLYFGGNSRNSWKFVGNSGKICTLKTILRALEFPDTLIILNGIRMCYLHAGVNGRNTFKSKSCFFMIHIHNMCKVEYEFIRPCFSKFVKHIWHNICILIHDRKLKEHFYLDLKEWIC